MMRNPANSARPDIARPGIPRDGGLVWKVEPSKDRATLLTIAVVNASDDVGPDNPAESYARCYTVIFKAYVFETIEHLSRIQKRRNLKVRHHPRHLRSRQMNTLFDTQRDKILVDEAIDTIASLIVLPSQGALLEERHLFPQRGLKIRPHDENRVFRLTR